MSAATLDFKSEEPRAAQEIVHLPRAVLKGLLNVIETRRLQRGDARFMQAHPRGDEVDVKAQPVSLGHDDLQVIARQRFAARQTELHRTQRTRFAQHPQPILGVELRAGAREIHRVVTEHTVQRAAIREFQQQPERRAWLRGGNGLIDEGVHRTATHFFPTAMVTKAMTSPDNPLASNDRSRSAVISAMVASTVAAI